MISITVEWKRVGQPTGFLVARYDYTTHQWWILGETGNKLMDLQAFVTTFDPANCTLPDGYAGLIVFNDIGNLISSGRMEQVGTDGSGNPVYVYRIFDDYGIDEKCSHYQILQYHAYDHKYTQPILSSPYTTPGDFDIANLTDNIICMKRTYEDQPHFDAIHFLDDSDTVSAVMQIGPVAGSPYSDLPAAFPSEFNKSYMFEIRGIYGEVIVDSDLLLADVQENVAIRS